MNKSIFWHRRDLRIDDNAGLLKAIEGSDCVQPLFIFDSNILSELDPTDGRVVFIHEKIKALSIEYAEAGQQLWVYYGKPAEIIPELVQTHGFNSLFLNRDYEPYAQARDQQMFKDLEAMSCSVVGSKDHVIFEKDEVVKQDGTPYTVFTPYSRKWKDALNENSFKAYDSKERLKESKSLGIQIEIPTLESMGFSENTPHPAPSATWRTEVIRDYHETRNFPALSGTSRLGIHLRFGTISIRSLARMAQATNETFLNELIWREFYQMLIYQFPHTVHSAFKPAYDRIQWESNQDHFEAWCEGRTGYPLVDAGMRELNATGFMHNRVRMVVASFLTKHLLIDWRKGEAYFAKKLLDFELASNIGGWQWASGSGCDAAPYFRVFNPTLQLEKFDRQMEYVKTWVPEWGTAGYPEPIIEHTFARNRVLDRYKSALNPQNT